MGCRPLRVTGEVTRLDHPRRCTNCGHQTTRAVDGIPTHQVCAERTAATDPPRLNPDRPS